MPRLRQRHGLIDSTHLESQEAVHLAHPLAVTASQVVVDGDHVHPLAGQGVQVGRQHSHQCLTLRVRAAGSSGADSVRCC